MKHLFLLLFLVVVGYALWHFVPKEERDKGVRLISRHGIQLGAIVVVLLALVAAAFHLTSTPLL